MQTLKFDELQTIQLKDHSISERRILFNSSRNETPSMRKKHAFEKTIKVPDKLTLGFKAIRKDMLSRKFIQNLMKRSYIYPRTQSLGKFLKESYTSYSDINQQIKGKLYNQYIKGYWSIVNIVFSLILTWLFPFVAAFEVTLDSAQWAKYAIVYIQIVIDIFIDSAQVDTSVSVHNLVRQISKRSRLRDFALILTSVLTLSGSLSGVSYTFGAIIAIICSVSRLYSNMQILEEIFYISGKFRDLKDLVDLILVIYYFAHFMACTWYTIGNRTEYLGNTWLIEYNLHYLENSIKYIYSFYLAVATMTTIGYGDIAPQNHSEVMVVTIIMFFSTCIFGYAMQSIGIILSNINERSKQYKSQIQLINEYMRKHKVDFRIQNQTRHCIKSQSHESIESSQKVQELIKDLPKPIQDDLNTNIKTQIIYKMSSFMNNVTQFSLKQLIPIIDIIYFMPQVEIFRQNTPHDYLYYIIDGEVQELESNSRYTFNTLKNNSSFGHYHFFSNQQPRTTFKTTKQTILARLSSENFKNILKQTEKDRQTFEQLAIQTQLLNFVSLGLPCSICGKYYHLNIDCPIIQFKPDIEAYVKRQNFTINHRMQFVRSNKKKYRTLSNFTEMQNFRIGSQSSWEEHDQSLVEVEDNSDIADADDFAIGILPGNITLNSKFKAQPFIPPKLRKYKSENQNIFKERFLKQAASIKTPPKLEPIMEVQNTYSFKKIIDQPQPEQELIFDSYSNYQYYFPQFNISEIAENINKTCYITDPIVSKYMFNYQSRTILKKKSKKKQFESLNIIFEA